MAPPIPGLRRPAPAPRRPAGDVVAGVLAVAALAVLVIGVPVALVTVLGLPIPHSKPALSLLTHQLSILSLIQILSVIVWLAWLQLVFCVAVEIRAAIKNAGVPARVPLSAGTQAIAHRLVTAAVLLFTASASLSPALAGSGPAARPAHTASADVQPGAAPVQVVLTSHETAALQAAEAAATASQAEKIYVVKPPVGRFHESLWEIAENHLGNGLRYREIFEMNKDRPQPDGTMLTIACLIRPGWVLRMPRDAYGPGVEIVAPGASGGPAGIAEQAGASQAQRASAAATGTKPASPKPAPSTTAPRPSASPRASSSAPAAAAEQVGANQAERVTRATAPPSSSAPPTPSPSTTGPSTPASGAKASPGASAAAAEQAGANQADQVTRATAPPSSSASPTPSPSTTGPSTPASGAQASPGASAAAAEQAGANQAGQVTQATSTQAGPPATAPASAANGQSNPASSPSSPPPASPATSASSATPSGPAEAAERVGAGQAERVSRAAAPPRFPHELAAASLLAAGLLTALGLRRREQLWYRLPGHAVIRPEGPAALAETALRLGANASAVRLLDTGLRSLSQQLAARGKTPPTVFAAHIGQVNLDLWIAAPDSYPPRPWQAVDGGQVWRLPVTAVADLDPDEAGAALAPYPGLVSIGTSDTGRMLVDLEVAQGLIAVRGPLTVAQALLGAIAAELATSRWSDQMRITLVGFSPELRLLAPERITVAATLEEAMPALEARAAQIEHALAAPPGGAVGWVSGQESAVGPVCGRESAVGPVSGRENSVLAGRASGVQPEAWAPHYLISAIPPTPRQRERLLTLAASRHRTAMGYVVAGDVPGAAWTWDVTEQGQLHAGVFGFDLRAQLLPAHQGAAVVELFRTARQAGGVPLADPPSDAAPAEQLVPGARMAVEVSLLGQVSVQAPGGIEPNRIGAATEIVAYLAAHPEGVSPAVLTHAIWPRGVTPQTRDAALARVRDWLGTDAAGHPNLVTDAAGRLRLGPQVRVDWQVFRSLVGHAVAARQAAGQPARAGQEEAAYLARALKLIHGQLLDGHDPRGYSWLAGDPLEYHATAQVADVAHRLCELRLLIGDAYGAMEAARSGLRFAFNDELLWRDLLAAAHATGQEHVLRSVVGELSARVSLDEVLPRMAPETEALIDRLLPSWRSSVA